MSKIGIQTRGSGAVMRKYLAKGGRIGLPSKRKEFKTHGRDVPTMAAKGGRIGKFGGGRTNLLEELGRVEDEPSNRNRRAEISRVHGELNRGYNKGGRVGLKHGGKPWGAGPKPGTLEHFQHATQTPKRKRKAIGGPAARAIKKGVGKALEPKGVFKKDSYKRPWEKPPQLRKSQKERREELRKKARKSGGHSKIIFHDEWKHIDPGLQKGLFKKEGGRAYDPSEVRKPKQQPNRGRHAPKQQPNRGRHAEGGRIGLKKGGSDKNWIQKATASIKRRKTKGKCTPITKPGCTGRAKALAKTFKKMAAKRKA